jgi:hypothetical protein
VFGLFQFTAVAFGGPAVGNAQSGFAGKSPLLAV